MAEISTWVHLWGDFFWNRHSWRPVFQWPWPWPSSIPMVLFRVGPQRIAAGSVVLFLSPLHILFCLPQVAVISTFPSAFLLLCRLILLSLATVMPSHHNFLTETPHLVQLSPWPDVKMTRRWSPSLWLIYEHLLSICCQPAAPFRHFRIDGSLPTPHMLHLCEELHCQLAWRNVWSTWTKLFHFTAVTRSCRLCLLRNVLIYLPSHACPSSQPKCSHPRADLPWSIPHNTDRDQCAFSMPPPQPHSPRHPSFHAAATELFPRPLLLPCSHLSTGFCKCLMLRESDPFLHPSHLPHSAQGSPPLKRMHWLFCWNQTVTH